MSFEYFDWAPLCCVELNRNIAKTVSMIAARDIDQGEELFINYGFEYWEGIDLPGKWKNKKEYMDRFNEYKRLLKSDSKGSFRDAFEDWLKDTQ